ncbi:sialoadhesin [Danio aesculapii]|uniref:sialoadhesin n=1 Tax=Danio aesculapii TaxID=1142201 RepID=UPI0024BF6A21|nr:sialoadhesin [Danio aesculapii]
MVCPALLLQSFIWFSLMATGVQYEVSHIISSMCAVRQSTALIPCRYDVYHRIGNQVSSAEWLHEKAAKPKVRVSQDPAFAGRVEFMTDSGNCSLVLRDVGVSDAGIFSFMLMDDSGRNWTNTQGVHLEVTDAEVEVQTQSDVVMEGDWIFFSCGSCIPSMTVPTYTWRKDGHLHSQYYGNNMLDLESVRLEDGGLYLCIISGHEELNSTHVNITVRPGGPPKSVSVSVSGSAVTVSGDSVTLSCSSDSNPPAVKYIWFKETQSSAVGSGQSFSTLDSGRYYCEAENKYGSQRSESVSVTDKGEESSSSWIMVTAGIAAAAFVTSVILIVLIRLLIRRKRVTPSEEKKHRERCKTVESPEDPYMSLDPKSRCSEYDTLDNIKRSCENTDSPEDEDSAYYNIKE